MSFYIKQQQRVGWDFFVVLVIFFVAFEVPYDLFVGWDNLSVKTSLDTFIYAVFIIDMTLNCFTEREQTFAGFWGWRSIAGFFSQKLSTHHQMSLHESNTTTYRTQPAMVSSYLKSGWFLVDFIAVFPFELLFAALSFSPITRTLRLARLGRLLRLLRMARFLKAFRFFDILRKHLEHRPALRRMVYMSVFVPWLGFIHSCVFLYAEKGNPSTEVDTFAEAMHKVFFEFIASEGPGDVTTLGYVVSVSAILCGLVFFGAFIGNFASFFEQIDHELISYEEKSRSWRGIFRNYKNIFDENLKKEIIQHLKEETFVSSSFENHANLIKSLDSSIELKIKDRVENAIAGDACQKTKKLSEFLS